MKELYIVQGLHDRPDFVRMDFPSRMAVLSVLQRQRKFMELVAIQERCTTYFADNQDSEGVDILEGNINYVDERWGLSSPKLEDFDMSELYELSVVDKVSEASMISQIRLIGVPIEPKQTEVDFDYLEFLQGRVNKDCFTELSQRYQSIKREASSAFAQGYEDLAKALFHESLPVDSDERHLLLIERDRLIYENVIGKAQVRNLLFMGSGHTLAEFEKPYSELKTHRVRFEIESGLYLSGSLPERLEDAVGNFCDSNQIGNLVSYEA